ncbi:MAG TPA: hypothetical protein VEI97_01360 [bacterium]|nr:hypothetical protein [bacterium]
MDRAPRQHDEDEPAGPQGAAEPREVYPGLRDVGSRLITFDREIKSWPGFLGWCLVTAVAYLLIGWGHWDFRDPDTGGPSWPLIGVFALVCVSFTYLLYPTPKPKSGGR